MPYCISKDVYSEVYSFINILDDLYKNKIPIDIFNTIEKNRNFEYNPIYNTEIPLDQQISKKDTLAFIAYLDLNYWCNEDEKKVIKNRFREKEKKEELLKKQLYNSENLFIKKQSNNININNTALIEYKKENLLIKIINKIRRYFSKK